MIASVEGVLSVIGALAFFALLVSLGYLLYRAGMRS